MVCVLLAAVFWTLNALNQSYETMVRIGISVARLPEDQALKEPLPDYLRVTLKGPGWDLLGYRLRDRTKSLTISYERIQEQDYLPASRLRNQMGGLFAQSVRIIDIDPDTLYTQLEQLTTRSLPVHPDLRYRLADGYGLSSNMSLEPKRVDVRGPKSLLDTMDSVATEPLRLGALDQEVLREVALQLPPHPAVSTPRYFVRLHIPAERLTEDEVIVPVEAAPPKPAGDVTFIPTRVQINYQVTLSRYNEISADSFQCVVHVPGLSPHDSLSSGPVSLPVELIKQPAFIYEPELRPAYVDYIIEAEP